MHTGLTSGRIRLFLLSMFTSGSLLGLAKPAHAQQFAEAKTFSIGVERLSGFVSSHTSYDTDNAEVTERSTTFTILPFQGNALTTYSAPRLAFDFFVTRGLSLGGAIGFGVFSRSVRTKVGNTSVESETDDLTGFLLAPRIGYAIMFNRTIGIWPRGGITYVKASSGSNLERDALALTVEAPLIIAPGRNVLISIAPTLDLGLDGGLTLSNGVVRDEKTNEFGVQLGLGFYF